MISVSTERLLIRSYNMEDSSSLLSFLTTNQEYLKEVLTEFALDVHDAASVGQYIKKTKIGELSKKMYLLGIWLYASQELIGEIVIFNTDWVSGKVEIGYYLGHRYQKNGFAGEALQAIINFFFNNFKIESICANTTTENLSSQKLLSKTGFNLIKETGRSKLYAIVRKNYIDATVQ